MLTSHANLQLTLDLVGVFVFALSGGLIAVRGGLDLFGVLVLATVDLNAPKPLRTGGAL